MTILLLNWRKIDSDGLIVAFLPNSIQGEHIVDCCCDSLVSCHSNIINKSNNLDYIKVICHSLILLVKIASQGLFKTVCHMAFFKAKNADFNWTNRIVQKVFRQYFCITVFLI
jgi:hypothetical protein